MNAVEIYGIVTFFAVGFFLGVTVAMLTVNLWSRPSVTHVPVARADESLDESLHDLRERIARN